MMNPLISFKFNCEGEAKFVQDRIISVERNTAEFCHVFAQYSRKVARLRDKCDEISNTCLNCSQNEQISKSLASGLECFADLISVLGNFGDLRTQSLDANVVQQFSKYEEISKHAKDDVKQIFCAKDRELAKRKQLDRIKERNPRNRQQIIQAETELVKATAEVSKSINNLDEKSTTFERQKTHDIKSILLDFVTIELGFHTKSIEILTQAFRALQQIDEESDVQAFQNERTKIENEYKRALKVPATMTSPKLRRTRGIFRSTNALGSLGALFMKKPPGIPKGPPMSKSDDTLHTRRLSSSDEESDEDDQLTSSMSAIEANAKVTTIPVRRTKIQN